MTVGSSACRLCEALAVGLALAGALQDEAEVVLEAALDGVVDGEGEDVGGGFAANEAAVEAGVDAVLRGGAGGIEGRAGSCKLLLGLDGDAELGGAAVGGGALVPLCELGLPDVCAGASWVAAARISSAIAAPRRVPGRAS